jgi:hypothetical protein
MARHAAFEAEAGGQLVELAYDTDDVAEISVQTGVMHEGNVVPEPDREAIVTIKFKPGRHPLWAPKEGGQ